MAHSSHSPLEKGHFIIVLAIAHFLQYHQHESISHNFFTFLPLKTTFTREKMRTDPAVHTQLYLYWVETIIILLISSPVKVTNQLVIYLLYMVQKWFVKRYTGVFVEKGHGKKAASKPLHNY